MSLILQDYSEKSIAIFGNTKSFVNKLKDLGGRFNPNLTHNGEKTVGWIFSNKKTQDLINFIDSVNSGEYKPQEHSENNEKSIITDLKYIRNDIDKLIKKYDN
jgi:hypothetical protein